MKHKDGFNSPLIPQKPKEFEKLLTQNISYPNIELISFPKPIDSSDLNIKHWNKIVKIIKNNYAQYDGFVILHGTDTLAYTSSLLSLVLKNLNKPIVLTGSQLPLIYENSDATTNLNNSIDFILDNDYRGVYVCFGGKNIYNGYNVYKNDINSFDGFASLQKVKFKKIKRQFNSKQLKIFKINDTKILYIHLYPNISLESWDMDKFDTIVISSYGNANMPIKLAKRLSKIDKPIILISQCKYGMIELGNYQSSKLISQKENLKVISNITTEYAIAKAYI